MSQSDVKSAPSLIREFLSPAGLIIGLLAMIAIVSLFFGNLYPFVILPVLGVIALSFFNIRWLYVLLFFLIPLSTEMELPGGINLDFPDELFMLGIFILGILWFAHRLFQLDLTYFYHPISILLLLHFLWIFVAALNAENSLFSIKFFLSKSWYIVVFFALPFYLFSETKHYKTILHAFFISLGVAVLIVTIRHGIEENFSFSGVNFVMGPFFRDRKSVV